MSVKHQAQKLVSGFLTLGSVVAIGTLSFIGSFAFSSSIYVCSLAFVLAGFVDGQVYWENIRAALSNFFEKDYSKKEALRQALENLAKNNRDNQNIKALSNNLFLKELVSLSKQLIKFRKNHDNLTEEQEAAMEKVARRIQLMEEFALKWIEKKKNQSSLPTNLTAMEQAISTLIDGGHFDQVLSKGTQKRIWAGAGLALSTLGGIFCFFASLGAYQSALEMAAVGATLSVIPGGVVIAVMAFGAISWTLLMCQSWQEVMNRGILREWLTAVFAYITTCLQTKSALGYLRVGLMCFSALVTIGLIVFASLATGGTWFQLVPSGANLFTFTQGIVNLIQIVGVITFGLPFLFFTAVNTFEATLTLAREFTQRVKDAVSRAKKNLKENWQKETVWQFFNPFRLINYALDKLVFAAHLVTDAFAADGFPEPKSSTVIGSGTNFFVDLPYMFPKGADEQVSQRVAPAPSSSATQHGSSQLGIEEPGVDIGVVFHDENDPSSQNGLNLEVSEHEPLIPTEAANQDSQQALEFEQNDKHHNHSSVFTKAILLPVRMVGVVWDWIGGIILYPFSLLYQCLVKPKNPVPFPTFQAAYDKFFPKPKQGEPIGDYQPGPQWMQQEMLELIEQDGTSYSSCSKHLSSELRTKIAVKQELASAIRNVELGSAENGTSLSGIVTSICNRQPGETQKTNYQTLAKHRFFPWGPTQSQVLVDELSSPEYNIPCRAQSI